MRASSRSTEWDGLQGRAALFSCLNVSCFLLMALAGNRAWDTQSDDDVEWLSTLPAPAWVLHGAKIVEAALWNPGGWLIIFPFFTGLGLHTGLGPLAPVLALGVSLPIFLCHAVLGSMMDLVHRLGLRSRLLRVLRGAAPTLGLLLFTLWLGASGLKRLNIDLLGSWLDFSGRLGWLPFSEPARALLSWRSAPLRGLAWLGLFAVETAALLGLGLLVVRRAYGTDLVHGSSTRSGARRSAHARAGAARRGSLGGVLGAVLAKELLVLWRNPSRSTGLLRTAVIFNALGMLLSSRLSGLDARLHPGLALFGVGGLLLMGVSLFLDRNQSR